MIPGQSQLASIHAGAAVALSRIASGDAKTNKPRGTKTKRRIQTVYLEGLLEPDYLRFVRQQLIAATKNDAIESVLILANSPGGFVQGCQETAEIVRRLTFTKRTTVVAEGYLCSAAYHVLSGATRIIASPSTIVGSCGVIAVMVDDAKAFEAAGVRVIPIASAPAKSRGLAGVAVSEEDIFAVRKSVEESRRAFQKDLRLGSRMTSLQRENAFESGEAHYAVEAKKLGFIDEVALTEDAVAKIFSSATETFEHLTGAAAVEKMDDIICEKAGVESPELAPESTVERIEKQYHELFAQAQA